ncbi:hypothetical protein ANN_25625 [Periplaneta americana]|uniref:DUF4817 domain-containing protein n=1 Tax=Periplaneta americana TaxID=6978 RepID=A0ABQ8S1Q4_PERAM|nr:hypothetical protein ANN_25625 [Periplaneta americana]
MPFVYTHQEYADIVYVYGLCDGNATAAVLAYQERFPNRGISIAQMEDLDVEEAQGLVFSSFFMSYVALIAAEHLSSMCLVNDLPVMLLSTIFLFLRVFQNKVLRKMFGAKRDEVTGEWRKLHNTELHALYSSSDIIRNIKSRRLRWAGHVARMGESRNAYRVLIERPEGKRPLGRPRRRWEDNIKMDLKVG